MKITLLTGKTYDLENAFDFPLKIHSSLRLKRLSLKIDHKKREVILSLPKFCPTKKAFEFINAHLDWIEEKLSALPQIKNFEDGEKISLFGKTVQICHQENGSAPKLIGDTLYVGGDKIFLHRRVKDYIKRAAQAEFLKRSKILAQKLEVTLKGVTIKDTVSRWGSCSTLHHINYNWRIALAPDFVIDYLITHEVSHLKHHDHSTLFWKTVESLNPDYQKGQSWLKQNGKSLYLYK